MLVHHFLENSAVLYPDKVALVCEGNRYTYRELNEMANRIANALLTAGMQRGDRVAVFMGNSLEAVVSIFGILKVGGVFIVIGASTKTDKLLLILKNSGASIIITDSQKAEMIAADSNNLGDLKAVFIHGNQIHTSVVPYDLYLLSEVLTSSSIANLPPVSIDMDNAMIIYTSGSTGTPKGVTMTHLNMVSAAESIIQYLENTSEDIILNVLPVSFDYGLYQILMGFKTGACIILERSLTYPYKIIDLMHRERVTGLPIVPTIAAILLQMEEIKTQSFDHLRYITNTAAALPISNIRKLREIFPRAAIYSMYGLTECKRVSYLPPDQIDIRPASVGKGMPNEEVYIVDKQGRRVGPNVTGELVVRGSNVMRGYWGMPEETAKKLRPGPNPGEVVLYTGDLFRMDEEGYLYFVSRTDDIIKCAGEKVSPREIEEVLMQIPGVIQAAVIGIPDKILGEAIKAFIVKTSDVSLTRKDVFKYCSTKLEDLMIPQHVEFTSSLPVTDNGKIDKRVLQ